MRTILHSYNASRSAFESWNLAGFAQRKAMLALFSAQLSDKLQDVFDYQQNHAATVVAAPQSLVSPTGETNELYTQGRGVGVILVDSEAPECDTAVVAMLSAMLAAGNSVILCCDNSQVNGLIEAATAKHTLPVDLVQIVARAQYSELLNLDIRNFVLIGNAASTAEVNQALAARQHAITALVAETDLETLEHSRDPKLVLRFVTEKVRSINITAIGGNAQLLELGNSTH